MGRWIAGVVILLVLVCAAFMASSSASNAAPQPNTLSDDFNLGVIDDGAAQ
jgi:hypothetical protein